MIKFLVKLNGMLLVLVASASVCAGVIQVAYYKPVLTTGDFYPYPVGCAFGVNPQNTGSVIKTAIVQTLPYANASYWSNGINWVVSPVGACLNASNSALISPTSYGSLPPASPTTTQLTLTYTATNVLGDYVTYNFTADVSPWTSSGFNGSDGWYTFSGCQDDPTVNNKGIVCCFRTDGNSGCSP